MNYYYDIKINFQDTNYMFYDWSEKDTIEFIKRIPIYQVTTNTLKDLISYNVIINEELLNNIKDKTKLKKNILKYCALFVSKNGAIALEFNDNGLSISRSFLQIEDEVNVLESLFTLPITKFNYKIKNKINVNNMLRIEEEIKRFIEIEVNSLYKRKKYTKLNYLYNEWFKKDNKNPKEMKEEMHKKLENGITEKEINIYNLIKLSYNNV